MLRTTTASTLLLVFGCYGTGDLEQATADEIDSEDASGELRRWGSWPKPRPRPRDDGATASGGQTATGGTTARGGSSAGGTTNGGTSAGGTATGGTATGGTATGGTATGGTATGGTATGGTATGGMSFHAAVNFKPPSAPDALGWLSDSGDTFGDRGNGQRYGWNQSHNSRGAFREFIAGYGWAFPSWSHIDILPGGTWEIQVPNGRYDVLVQGSCIDLAGVPQRIQAEGVTIIDFVPLPGCYDTYTAYGSQPVTVSDGRLTITHGEGASGSSIGHVNITGM